MARLCPVEDDHQCILFSGLSALQILRDTSSHFPSPPVSYSTLPSGSTSQNRTFELTQSISFISAGCIGWKRGLAVAVEAEASKCCPPDLAAPDERKDKVVFVNGDTLHETPKQGDALGRSLQEAISTDGVRERLEAKARKKSMPGSCEDESDYEDDGDEDISAEETASILDSLMNSQTSSSFTDSAFYSPSLSSSDCTSPSLETQSPPKVIIKEDHIEYHRNPAEAWPSSSLPTFTVRIAIDDNASFDEKEEALSKLRTVLERVMQFVGGSEGDKWRDVVKTTSNRPAATSYQALLVRDFANGALLSQIVACHEPYMSKMVGPFARDAIRAWDAMKGPLRDIERRQEELALRRVIREEEKEEVEQLEMSPGSEERNNATDQGEKDNKQVGEQDGSAGEYGLPCISSPPSIPTTPQATDSPPSLSETAPETPSSEDTQQSTEAFVDADSESLDSVASPPPAESLSSVIEDLVDDLRALVDDSVDERDESPGSRTSESLSPEARHERLLLSVWTCVLCLCHRKGGIDDLEDVWNHLVQKYPGVYESENPELGADDPSSILDFQYTSSNIPSTCPLVRMMLRLARYLTAGIAVTKYLLQASATVEHFNIRIEYVPGGEGAVKASNLRYRCEARKGWVGMLTGAGIIEPVDKAILKEDGTADVHHEGKCTTRDDAGTFPPEVLEVFEKRWSDMLKNSEVYIHAPMKLAMFYASNPYLAPIAGVVGVSKSVCMGCDAFLQLAQSSDGLYNTAQTGPPVELTYVLTIGLPDPTFLFPNVNTCLDKSLKLPPLERERIQTRLDLISRTIADEIRKGVGGMLLKLYAPSPLPASPEGSQTPAPQGNSQSQRNEVSSPSATEPTSNGEVLHPSMNSGQESSTTTPGSAAEALPQLEQNLKKSTNPKHWKGIPEPKKLRERLKRWGLWKCYKAENSR